MFQRNIFSNFLFEAGEEKATVFIRKPQRIKIEYIYIISAIPSVILNFRLLIPNS